MCPSHHPHLCKINHQVEDRIREVGLESLLKNSERCRKRELRFDIPKHRHDMLVSSLRWSYFRVRWMAAVEAYFASNWKIQDQILIPLSPKEFFRKDQDPVHWTPFSKWPGWFLQRCGHPAVGIGIPCRYVFTTWKTTQLYLIERYCIRKSN